MTRPVPPPTDPVGSPEESLSLLRLLRTLINDLAVLVRQEIALTRTEVRQNVRKVAGSAGGVAIGGGVVLVGVLVLVAFLIVGLGVLLGGAYWLSALIVALVLLIGGGAIGYLGAKRLSARGIAPTETVRSLSETKEWAGDEIQDLKASLKRGSTELPGQTAPAVHHVAGGVNRRVRMSERMTSGSGSTGPRIAVEASEGDDDAPPLSLPIYKRVFREIIDDDVPGQAAKVAFYMFSSLPPALLVIFALTGLLGGESVAEFITTRIQDALPGSADEETSAAGYVSRFVDEVVYVNAPGPLSIGLLLGLWASSAVFVALTESLNRAFDVPEARSWFRKRALALGTMLGFALLFLCGSIVLLAGPRIAEVLRLGSAGAFVWSIAQWPLAFVLVVVAFFIVYYMLPNRDQSGCRSILMRSSAIAAGLWLLATLGFRLYITDFSSYSATYGFVGAVMVLLLWMYLTSFVILVGGEISAEMERQPS